MSSENKVNPQGSVVSFTEKAHVLPSVAKRASQPGATGILSAASGRYGLGAFAWAVLILRTVMTAATRRSRWSVDSFGP